MPARDEPALETLAPPPVEGPPHAVGARDAALVGAAVGDRAADVVALWERLDADGPLFGSTTAGTPEDARAKFLVPLAELLRGALAGQSAHRAIYIDTRQAYLPKGLTGPKRAALFDHVLTIEEGELAELLAPGVAPELTAGALRALHAPLRHVPGADETRVVLVGDCLFNDVRVFLAEELERRGRPPLDADHLYFSAGNTPLAQDDIQRSISAAPPDVVGLSLFTYDGIPPYSALIEDAGGLDDAQLGERVATLVGMLESAVESIRAVTDATILVHTACALPISQRKAKLRVLPLQTRARKRVVAAVTEAVAELVAGTENTLLVDETALIARGGGLGTVGRSILGPEFAGAYLHPSHFGPVLGAEYADVLASYELLGKAKALLVDFDNTLWAGVMAEGEVVHDRELQRLLRQLKEAGVLLVALSKNDLASIRWDEMELEPEDFVLQMIDWRAKPLGTSDAIAALDLAPEAFVLLDDNPVERALVQENVAGVRAVDPADPFVLRSLRRWLEFPSTKQTDEARRRTELYREAAERRQAMGGGHDYDAMMASLDLSAAVRRATRDDVPRLQELIQRTNQFNTTTRRRSTAEITALLDSADHSVHVASLSDRFGDLGVVAVVVLDHTDPGSVEIDSFIMSCRAMGFGLEQLVLHELLTGEVGAGASVVGRFAPTDRNGPAAALYPSHGFAEAGEGRWLLAPDAPRPARPAWFA